MINKGDPALVDLGRVNYFRRQNAINATKVWRLEAASEVRPHAVCLSVQDVKANAGLFSRSATFFVDFPSRTFIEMGN